VDAASQMVDERLSGYSWRPHHWATFLWW